MTNPVGYFLLLTLAAFSYFPAFSGSCLNFDRDSFQNLRDQELIDFLQRASGKPETSVPYLVSSAPHVHLALAREGVEKGQDFIIVKTFPLKNKAFRTSRQFYRKSPQGEHQIVSWRNDLYRQQESHPSRIRHSFSFEVGQKQDLVIIPWVETRSTHSSHFVNSKSWRFHPSLSQLATREVFSGEYKATRLRRALFEKDSYEPLAQVAVHFQIIYNKTMTLNGLKFRDVVMLSEKLEQTGQTSVYLYAANVGLIQAQFYSRSSSEPGSARTYSIDAAFVKFD